MEIRRLIEEELHEADLLWLQSFERGNLSSLGGLAKYRESFEDRIVRFGLWEGSTMQATLQMYAILLQFNNQVQVPGTYISSIACAPMSRGRGYGSECLKRALEHMREVGQALSTLCPFEFAYYRQFGWEWVNIRRFYRVPSHVLHPVAETECVRIATSKDRSAIEETYRRIANRYRGAAVRDAAEWDLILDGSKSQVSYVYVYQAEHGIEGYLVLRGGGSEETYLPEFLTETQAAKRALLGLLGRLHMQSKVFTWDAPEDDDLWSQVFHRDMQTTIGTSLQGRIVDVTLAINALRPSGDLRGEFVLRVIDPFASWNDGNWQITVEAGRAAIQLTDKSPQIEMDIQALTQAYFGTLSVEALRNRQRLESRNEQAFCLLRGLLDGPPMWSNGPL